MPLTLVGQEKDVAFYLAQVSRHGVPVLVLGCGNGRLALELAGRGHPVVAVDPSPLMVSSAEERRAREPHARGESLRLVSADLRSLRLRERFPLVLAPQNALGLMSSFDDFEALLATVRHHLDATGAFVFDVLHSSGGARLRANEHAEAAGTPAAAEASHPAFIPHLRERRRVPGRKGDRAIRRLRLRQFEPSEVDTALEHAGLVALERFGAFDGKPFDESDPVQVVVAGVNAGLPAALSRRR